MIINRRTLSATACICLLCGLPLMAITRTVSKNNTGTYTLIQAAVNASVPGDTVKILDAATYPEQVTIDSTKNSLTLTSANPTSLNKPKIVWQDQVNEGPKTCAEAQIDSLITFDQNGALRLMRAHNVVINGIAVDGGGVLPFGSPNPVWPAQGSPKTSCQYPLVHGNTGIVLWISGDIIIKNCDVQRAYFGIYLKDRNEGGIFANANPGDNAPWNVVPLSGFAQTGNHIIEYSRVHDNSYGIFVESAWDLGSTIRYNLIYENHHPNATIAAQVKALNSEGGNQPGAAMFFKDDMLCPLSIYNNTFWHNYLIFCGGWQAGYQHLVFNNIFAKPFTYWSVVPVFSSLSYMDISYMLPNRITNCVYSIQAQPAQIQNGVITFVMVMNNFPQLQGNGLAVPPGSPLTNAAANAPFPAAANIRWLEMDSTKFLSMDPATVNFLEPNWNDPLIQTYIKNQGWTKSGVKKLDGTMADIGAIQSSASMPVNEATIRPIMPVLLSGLTAGSRATVNFSLMERVGRMQNPSIKFFRWVSNLQFVVNSWAGGAAAALITTANINDIVPLPSPVQVGANTYTITIPVAQTTPYAFFEGIIEGAGPDGLLYTSSTGFLPYRKLDYKFLVQVFALNDLSTPLTQVRAGDSVVLSITPQKADNTLFTNTVNPAAVRLQSGFTLWSGNPPAAVTYPAGITGPTNKIVMFTKVPPGGLEYVLASGKWSNTAVTPAQELPFLGSSNGIRVLAGPPATVVFQDPPSIKFAIPPPTINPGVAYPGYLFVYDKYGNKVNAAASITLSSLTPTYASFVGGTPDLTITTDTSGTGRFNVSATSTALEGNLVKLQAQIPSMNNLDTAYMTVGKRQEYLFIFYSDTNKYNPGARLEGQVGDRLPVTIIATKAALDTITITSIAPGRTDTFAVSGAPSLVFFNSAAATTPAATFVLVNGRATAWVSSADTIINGCITATSVSGTIGNSSQRCEIYFTRPAVSVDSAFYYARTGFGAVDSVDIFYKVKLGLIPDSITLYWPLKADTLKRVVRGASAEMKISVDSTRITIVLSNPFPREITAAGNAADKLGITYNRPNNNPGVPVPESNSSFAIKERVGPLVMTAQVVERRSTGPGIDTLFVSFSEPLDANSLTGNSLIAIHNGAPSLLTVQSASYLDGNRFRFVVSSAASGPVAGDSLRIQPGGPLKDVAGNYAHPLNRPVEISVILTPANILSGYYVDNDAQNRADGVVDSVVIVFDTKVSLPDLIVSLDWGGAIRADSIGGARMNFVGTSDSIVEISVLGQFKNLPAGGVKTSGTMNAAVLYRSFPNRAPAAGSIADRAAPVAADSAIYSPGATFNDVYIDTLQVTFSEQIKPPAIKEPFNLQTADGATFYSILLNSVDPLENTRIEGDKFTYRFLVDSIRGVPFPATGDSLWIKSSAAIADTAGNIQTKADNKKVKVHVNPVPFHWDVTPTITKNPFSPPVDSFSLRFRIHITRKTLAGNVKLSAWGKIYDALGNCVHVWNETPFKATHSQDVFLDLGWNGRNQTGRLVGSGVYQAIFTFNQNGQITSNQRIKIGVKR